MNENNHLTNAGHMYIEAGKQIFDIEYQMGNTFTNFQSYATTMMPSIASNFQGILSRYVFNNTRGNDN